MGLVQLQGVVVDSQNSNKVVQADVAFIQSQRNVINSFIEPQMSVDFGPGVNVSKTNLYNWTFAINNSSLTISDPTKASSRSFPFDRIIYNQSGIFNKTSNAPLLLAP